MNEKVQSIEKILGIKLEVKEYGDLYDENQKNTYSLHKENIDSLQLNDINIGDLSKLTPYLTSYFNLELTNCIADNFTQFLDLKCGCFSFNNVTFKTNDIRIRKSFPAEIRFSNMTIDANLFECFQESSPRGVKYLEFKNCHINNIEAINKINLYQLNLDTITYTYNYKKTQNLKSAHLLILKNTKFKNISFIPCKESLDCIYLENCEIESLSGLNEFPKLDEIYIDSDTTVFDKKTVENPLQKEIKLNLTKAKNDLNLNSVLCLKNFVKILHFNKVNELTIGSIKAFDILKTLSFEKSTFNVTLFLPIANQIESLILRDSNIENYDSFIKFNNLNFLEIKSFDDDAPRTDFKNILPLYKQLKSLQIWDFEKPIKNFSLLKEFTVLDCLTITNKSEDSEQFINEILKLTKLKKLNLGISDCSEEDGENEEDNKDSLNVKTFSLKHLTNLEFLVLESEFNFIGFEYLQNLQSLKIGEDSGNQNINSFPKMENLKRLHLTTYDYNIEILEQFPNLEYLKLKGVPRLTLGSLKNLKVLDLTNSSIENFNEIEPPNLERLDLSSIQNKIDLTGLSKFPNLKWLSLFENSFVNDISVLKHLKKLEYLDLYETEVSDVSVLNELLHLKEVNFAGVSMGDWVHLVKQIERQEIIHNCSLPSILFRVWEEDEFDI